ncbi:MAG: hypothetical protein ACE5PV_23555 [Candidatus Poribacteria bacterium]
MPEEIQDYFRSTASQMKERLDIIKGVVIQGRERNVPVGDTCENALRSVLRDSLPARFGVATGLVLEPKRCRWKIPPILKRRLVLFLLASGSPDL